MTRKRLTRDQRRAQLLDVAAALVTEAGFEAVTMEGVASRAGVSKGLGYAYFTNRDELLAALFDREMHRLDAAVAAGESAAARADGTFDDRLRAIITAGLDVVAERGVLIGALLRGKAPAGPLEEKRRSRQAVVERYFAGLAVAEYGLGEREAGTAVSILLGGYGAALDLWARGRATREEITDTFVRLAAGGLASLRS